MADKVHRFIIVPDEVIQSQDLNNGAKLLLGFVMRLSNKCGYCWASNEYLANYFDVNRATIIRWINELKERRYIKCNIRKTKRRIRVSQRLLKDIHYCQVNETVANLKKSIRKMYQYGVWKKKVKEKYKEKCGLCDITENQQYEDDVNVIGLDVHHILPITLLIDYYHITNKDEAKQCKLLWNINNGIVLCDKCHRMKHGIRYWDVLIEETGRKNAMGRKNADIDDTTYHKQEQLDSAALANKDDFNIKTKRWTGKDGKKHGIDTIDYGEESQ